MFFKQGDTPICLDLISWGLETFTFIDKLVQKTFKELDEGVDVGAGSYWRTVCMTLIGCRFETCINLLSLLKGDKAAERFINLLSNFDWNWLTDEGKNLISNPWLSVHLLDTLLQTDSEYASIPKLAEIRDFLLMDYASGLIQNSWYVIAPSLFLLIFTVTCRSLFALTDGSLWEIGADYLLYCGSEGRLRLENHIEALHIEDEVMAEKLMRICVEQELDDSKACVVNTMTYEYLREGEWSAALSWALRGGRGPALDTAVNRIVWHADKDELASLSLLDHLSDYVAELESPSLAFLFNYYRFHRFLKMGDVRSAAPVLVSLISSTNVPLCFHKILFGYLMLILADLPQVRSLKHLLLTRLADAEMASVCVQ
ncbi:hypothetical protein OESDEN_02818 [Oesophagostomum dentatum]|uniref:Nuclear pore complex protein Nup85 n=1 Tax=Oesophagostomum dentatum TaxID=61180 RepID=A0A0B1TN15_OESDE|nr:hypothetical protein OESDEN_02818 [Oesophagostomum dentatum]